MLHLLSKVYAGVVTLRNILYDKNILKSYGVDLPVISVGNVTAGGNAKTPLCIMIAEELKKRGYTPVILSRGYGGKMRGPHAICGAETPQQVGDEALLMFRRANVPVVICRDRLKGAQYIKERNLGQVVILDDGFQHRRLRRSLNIVSIDVGSADAVEDFLQGKILPEGRFREPREKALRRADLIVFASRRYYTSLPSLDPRLFKVIPQGLPIFRSYLKPEEVVSLKDGKSCLEKGGVVAFCAIAKPERFFDTLNDLGFSLLAKESFRDHYAFTSKNIEDLKKKYLGAKLVCTEKDGVKILPQDADGIYILKTATKVQPEDAFFVELLKKIEL